MENKANYAIVGLFTLAVIAGIFGFVFWFTRASENSDRRAYRVVFVGSVSGLSTGAAVRFNGLRVGEVTAVNILASDPSRVVAQIAVNPSTPIKTDTKARLETQGLTGVANIQLTAGQGIRPILSRLMPVRHRRSMPIARIIRILSRPSSASRASWIRC